MGTPDYRYDESVMLRSIERFRIERRKAAAQKMCAIASVPVPVCREPPKVDVKLENIRIHRCSNISWMRSVVHATGEYFGVSPNEIIKHSNQPDCVFRRRIAYFIIHKRSEISASEVGRYFNQHHTTVLYALKIFKRDGDKTHIKEACAAIESKLLLAKRK